MRFPSDSPLSAFAPTELDAIFAACDRCTLAADATVVTEGEPGDSMYFLIEGTALARMHGQNVRSFAPGSYFGELSFINPGHRRSATIVATSDVTLLVLGQASIAPLLANHPHAIFTLLRKTCAFLVDAERKLVTDLRETIKHLEFTRHRLSEEEETARTDKLTGLYNRRGFDAELASFMERARAIGGGLALIAMDLDHFKPVNDTMGHAAGDFVLGGVGKILREGLRKTDLPCRVGGDEFAILIADLDESSARARAEQVRAAVGRLAHPGNERGIQITSTMGGTMYRPGETAAELVQRADEALYAAKRAGRNRIGWL